MKITKSELKEIIREEAQKFKKKIELEKELKSLQEQIEEVRATGTREIPGGGGHGYGKDFETKSRNGGPESLVEDEFEEFSFEDEMDEMEEEPIMPKDELDMDSIHSEEEVDIDAILAEIMGETSHEDEEGDEKMSEMHKMEGMDDMNMDEMEDMNMDEMEEMEGMNESKNTNKKVISEEISRMQQLAGIKKVM
jgi:hypothetical protein